MSYAPSLAVVLALTLPASALALGGSSASGSASAAQYTVTPPTNSAQLPFTGYVLISAALVGLILLSVGLLIRRYLPRH